MPFDRYQKFHSDILKASCFQRTNYKKEKVQGGRVYYVWNESC